MSDFDFEFWEVKIQEICEAPSAAHGVLLLTEYFNGCRENLDTDKEDAHIVLSFLDLLRELSTLERFGEFFDSTGLTIGELSNVTKISNAMGTLRSAAEKGVSDEGRSAETDRLKAIIGTTYAIEISDADLSRMQVLINQLRDLISGTDELSADHKRRLLARLESLQGALHRTMSKVDVFWGFVGEAGVAIGQFGEAGWTVSATYPNI